jgi:Fe2+ or Zn2+ uptake regulation protein
MTESRSAQRKPVRLSAQQSAVLLALIKQSRVPTTILRGVRVRYEDAFPHATWKAGQTFVIGEPVYSVLRRLEKRGLVSSERGSAGLEWGITDEGLAVMGWTRG